MIRSLLSISDLDGSNGFRLDGINDSDRSGRSVPSAGNVNGDGIDLFGATLLYKVTPRRSGDRTASLDGVTANIVVASIVDALALSS